MVRLRYALVAAIVLIGGWLVREGHRARWQAPKLYEQFGAAAFDWGLAGLGAVGHIRAARLRSGNLQRMPDAESAEVIPARVAHDIAVAARMLAAANRPSAALHLTEQAYRAAPSNATAALMWRLRYICGAESAAKRELTMLSDRTDSAEVLAALGACLVDEGNQAAAQNRLESALEADSHLSEAWFHLARVFEAQGKQSKAVRAATKAWQSAEDQPVIRYRARQMVLNAATLENGFTIAGRSPDYYRRAASYWIQRHRAALVALAVYVVFLFLPTIASALKSSHRDPLGG